MLFDNLYDKEDKSKYEGYSDWYYNKRSHQDNQKHFCQFCNAHREFLYDRCVVCHNN